MINDLSGGEKARLQLALLMLERNNVLILDEPTNHLDIDSKEMLEQALQDFEGTLIFVSHDRYFINQLANKVFDMDETGGTMYAGDYQYYLDKTEEKAALQAKAEAEQAEKKASENTTNSYSEQKLRNVNNVKLNVKSKIAKQKLKLASKNRRIDEQLTQPEIFSDPEKLDNWLKRKPYRTTARTYYEALGRITRKII